jgi:hypothetical protein
MFGAIAGHITSHIEKFYAHRYFAITDFVELLPTAYRISKSQLRYI